jgi:hypothetical protein
MLLDGLAILHIQQANQLVLPLDQHTLFHQSNRFQKYNITLRFRFLFFIFVIFSYPLERLADIRVNRWSVPETWIKYGFHSLLPPMVDLRLLAFRLVDGTTAHSNPARPINSVNTANSLDRSGT